MDTENKPPRMTLDRNTKPCNYNTLVQVHGTDLSVPKAIWKERGGNPPFAVGLRVIPSPALRIFAPQNEITVTDIAHAQC